MYFVVCNKQIELYSLILHKFTLYNAILYSIHSNYNIDNSKIVKKSNSNEDLLTNTSQTTTILFSTLNIHVDSLTYNTNNRNSENVYYGCIYLPRSFLFPVTLSHTHYTQKWVEVVRHPLPHGFRRFQLLSNTAKNNSCALETLARHTL